MFLPALISCEIELLQAGKLITTRITGFKHFLFVEIAIHFRGKNPSVWFWLLAVQRDAKTMGYTKLRNQPQQSTKTTPEIAKYNFLHTLGFIYNKIKISFFYELLFLILNVLLFSLVKLKLHTYHNSCLPFDFNQNKNNTKLRLLSKKLKLPNNLLSALEFSSLVD